jgi:uncharacterized protein YutE (UPF0331/DUF86 family)
LVLEKLTSLCRCIQRIEEKRAHSVAELEADLDRQDIISLNVERAVQLSVDVGAHILAETGISTPQTMGDIFSELGKLNVLDVGLVRRMRMAVALRNLSVHCYTTINWAIVHEVTHEGIRDLKAFVSAVNVFLDPENHF